MEDRIDATDRLRREGRWTEASEFKERRRRALRAERVPKEEAKDRAWAEMLAKFPPLPPPSKTPKSETASGPLDEIFVRLRDDPAPVPFESIDKAVDDEFLSGGEFVAVMIGKWADQHHVTVPRGAAAILQAKVLGLVLADRLTR